MRLNVVLSAIAAVTLVSSFGCSVGGSDSASDAQRATGNSRASLSPQAFPRPLVRCVAYNTNGTDPGRLHDANPGFDAVYVKLPRYRAGGEFFKLSVTHRVRPAKSEHFEIVRMTLDPQGISGEVELRRLGAQHENNQKMVWKIDKRSGGAKVSGSLYPPTGPSSCEVENHFDLCYALMALSDEKCIH